MRATILYIFLALSLQLSAQSFNASVTANPVAVGEQFQLTFTFEGNGKNFKAPVFEGLRILNGPSQSTSSSMQIINGQRSMSKTTAFSYFVTALNEGSITIGPASIQANGQIYQTKPLKLKVTKADPNSKSNVLNIKEKVFIKAHVNRIKLYQGQQMVVSYKLYSQINLADINILKLPELNGFWKEEVETSSRPKVETIDGIKYNVWEIKRMIVTPQRSGILEVDPMGAKVLVQIRKQRQRDPFRDPFGMFDSYQNIEEEIQSTTKKIEVLSFPEGAPDNFAGAVGQFKIDAKVDKTEALSNEAISYKLSLSGDGNLHLIDNIPLSFPEAFEAYDPEVTDRTFTAKNGVSGKKVFEHLLIARYQGQYEIPAVNFSFFNPKKKQYETISTKAFQLHIKQGKETSQQYQSSESLQQEASNKLIDIKQSAIWKKRTKSQWTKYTLLLSLLPFLTLIALLIRRKMKENALQNTGELNFKKSHKIARKRLKNAKNHLENNEKEAFFEEIEKSFWEYFSHKFKVDAALLSKDNIHKHFEENKVREVTTDKFIQIINACEFCRFAPSALEANKMSEVYQKATEVIVEIEEELKR